MILLSERTLSGRLRVELTSASLEQILNTILQENIEVSDLFLKDILTCHFTVKRSDFRKLEYLVQKTDGKLVILEKHGMIWALQKLLNRPVLIILLVFLCFLSVIT